MLTADVTHVQQGFRVPIPHMDRETGSEIPVMTLCQKYLKYLKFGKPFRRVCENVCTVRNVLRATVDSLTKIQRRIIKQAVGSLPQDDRQWVVRDWRQTEWDVERDSPPRNYEGSPDSRLKRETHEPELSDLHYHIFDLAAAGDVDYNRQIKKVLQESLGNTNRNMLDLTASVSMLSHYQA